MKPWIKNTIAVAIFAFGIILAICGIVAGIMLQSWIVFGIMEFMATVIITGTVQYTAHEMDWPWC